MSYTQPCPLGRWSRTDTLLKGQAEEGGSGLKRQWTCACDGHECVGEH